MPTMAKARAAKNQDRLELPRSSPGMRARYVRSGTRVAGTAVAGSRTRSSAAYDTARHTLAARKHRPKLRGGGTVASTYAVPKLPANPAALAPTLATAK